MDENQNEPKIEEVVSSGSARISAVTIGGHDYLITQTTDGASGGICMIHARSCKCLQPEIISKNAVTMMDKMMKAVTGLPGFNLFSDQTELVDKIFPDDPDKLVGTTGLQKSLDRIKLLRKPFLSMKEVCVVLDMNEETVVDLVSDGKLREFRDAGKAFFQCDEVKKLIDEIANTSLGC